MWNEQEYQRNLRRDPTDMAEIARLRAEVERLRAAERWIPCSERLPDTTRDVLVTDGDDICRTYYYVAGGYWGQDKWHPTHWRELPPMPTDIQ